MRLPPYYLYFQYIKPDQVGTHGLAMHRKRSAKARHRSMMSDVDKCTHQVNLLCGSKMLYCIKDLHRIAHGSHNTESKEALDAVLKSKSLNCM